MAATSRLPWKKIVAGLVLLLGFLLLLYLTREHLTLKQLTRQEQQLRKLQSDYPAIALGAAAAFYVLVTGLSLPGAAVLSLAYGWLFGAVTATILLSFASTAGASLAMLMSRYFLGSYIQKKYARRLAQINPWLEREGPFYLFWLRLIPTIPFFAINLVMGLTKIPLRTFWWVSQLGMLPGTCLYAYAGSTLPTLEVLGQEGWRGILRWELLLAFILLGAIPLVLRKIFRQKTVVSPEAGPPQE